MDGGAWRALVHGVSKSQTHLSTHVLEKQQQEQLKEDESVFDLVHTYNVFKNKGLHYNFLTK